MIEPVVCRGGGRGGVCVCGVGGSGSHGHPWILFTVAIKLPLEMDLISTLAGGQEVREWGGAAAGPTASIPIHNQ